MLLDEDVLWRQVYTQSARGSAVAAIFLLFKRKDQITLIILFESYFFMKTSYKK